MPGLRAHAGQKDVTPLLSSGPLSELHFPIDSLTKKPKGFAFVTFMFPEHAVKAYAEVDGQVFQVTVWGWQGGCRAQVIGQCACVRACARMPSATFLRKHTQWCAKPPPHSG